MYEPKVKQNNEEPEIAARVWSMSLCVQSIKALCILIIYIVPTPAQETGRRWKSFSKTEY
jgi:hypothetical protein